MTQSVVTNTAEETQRLGEVWGREAQPGWIVGLRGDLGAGKTQIVKGFAKAVGVDARIQSPTFALVHEYKGGRLPLFHLDLYRLENEAQIRGAGLEQYLYQNSGISIVEWVDRWPELVPPMGAFWAGRRYRYVCIETLGEITRRIEYEDFGA
jgi:tRNA threonylcarbamoyladenosine biosynthesis protein TsaE